MRAGIGRTIIIAVAAVFAAVVLVSAIPSLNPFGTEIRDRSQPAVLKSIEKLSQYRAATANLQVIVDVEEDAALLPGFIKGEKVLFVAAGNVDASVDFRRLEQGRLEINEERTEATITLPYPVLSEAVVDPERSRVFDRDRGVLDRIAGVFEDNPNPEQPLYVLAQQKLLEAAREDKSLEAAAQRNTTAMLEGLLGGLGFERVTVRFDPPRV